MTVLVLQPQPWYVFYIFQEHGIVIFCAVYIDLVMRNNMLRSVFGAFS